MVVGGMPGAAEVDLAKVDRLRSTVRTLWPLHRRPVFVRCPRWLSSVATALEGARTLACVQVEDDRHERCFGEDRHTWDTQGARTRAGR